MKVLKIVKYTLIAVLFIVMTSFKPKNVILELKGGEAQMNLPIVND